MLRSWMAASIFALTLLGCVNNDPLKGYHVDEVSSYLGDPVLKQHDQWYWCIKSTPGVSQVVRAKVDQSAIVESMQFKIFYEGGCSQIAEIWGRERWDTYN